MTIQLAYNRLLVQLYDVYDNREAANIADMVIEHVTGQPKIERIMYKNIPVSNEQQQQLEMISNELLKQRPVQYILGEAWFMGLKLLVNEHVLIPRPETEELVEWIINDIKKTGKNEVSLIDIGTGSGCIPIAVKKKMPNVTVSAIEVSDDALQVAKLNSIQQKVQVNFLQQDFLNAFDTGRSGKYDIIVSNPPYIRHSEEALMRENVLKYEPKIALFVPHDDPLIFYKTIAKFSQAHLQPKGSVYVEINEALGEDVVTLFKEFGFTDVILKKDMQSKDRMVKASN